MASSDVDKEAEARSKAAEEQNKKAQEDARRQIDEDNERKRQAAIDSFSSRETTTTAPTDFETAAKATEELAQPPNPFNARELKQPAGKGQPKAKNVTPETLPEDLKAENVATSEAVAPSPTTQTAPRKPRST